MAINYRTEIRHARSVHQHRQCTRSPNPKQSISVRRSCLSTSLRVGSEEGIAVVRGWDKSLLNRAHGHPAKKILHRPCLVISSRGSRSSEGLLVNHGSCGLVVDVEVTGSMRQCLGCLVNSISARQKRGRGNRG